MNFEEYGPIMYAALKLNNTVYSGKTHAYCFEIIGRKKIPYEELKNVEQGFLTENGKFVDRKLGLKIAEHFNQIKTKHPSENELYSEDYLER